MVLLYIQPLPCHLISHIYCSSFCRYDSLPSGIYLGGAPTNVAVHLASLFHSVGDHSSVAIACSLGNDQLGREAHRRIGIKGVRTDYIQYHATWETGMATAVLDENGDATYEFNTPAAWDGLQMDDRLSKLIQNDNTKVYIMGTIAARLSDDDQGATSSSTLKTVRNNAPEGTVVLDVNLRNPWFTSESVLELAKGEGPQEEAKKLALLKLNEEELCMLESWCGIESGRCKDEGLSGSVLKARMEQLATNLNTQRVCVTRGKDGAALLCTDDDDDKKNQFCENKGYDVLSISNNNDSDSDTVGAGDAFLSALVNSLFILKEQPERALEQACALGGFVASCKGATPEHKDAPDSLRQVFS